ncbi:MAG TPA: hypothetical protein PKA77_04110 [Chitinophagaceae bacterium]|jgi:hypothetical protein|nr:hypothetical protein [Chitinophagaceae bacterium]HMU57697.1 hypothetical protein [Chitinophagaceae bacterium]
MNKKYLYQVFFFFFLIITLLGCEKKQEDDSCLSFNKAPVTKIEGSNSALVNQEIILTVSFGCYNGCGQFGSFDEVISGNATTITVNTKYEGCVCTQDAPIRQASYKFKKSQAGTFDLKFLQAENTYLIHTITVQ